MQFVFGATMRWAAEENMPEEAFGNAVLSRWPIAANANHLLNLVPNKGQRAMLEARIQLPSGHPLTVYQTHLDHTDEAARVTQLRSVREWTLRDRNRPHFVMGDFNAVSPWDMDAKPEILSGLQAHELGCNMVPDGGPQVVARMEQAGYVDVFTRFGKPGARSYVPSQLPIRIDYVFASQPMVEHVEGCTIWRSSGEEGSDHLPVVVDFEM